jgi:membrane protein insertase Oxa1/YidC/SpoIIIJ
LLIQFPILIGLYQAIYFALAATPFQLVDLSERLLIPGLDGLIPLQRVWLGMDLTQPPTPPVNPAYALLLPLLVMATTYLQSKMTMSMQAPASSSGGDGAMDQAQAMTRSMTTIMPIMFGVFALSFSVGLSVYFITSNVVGIIQYSPAGKRVLDRLFSGGRKQKDKNLDALGDDDEDETDANSDKSEPKAQSNKTNKANSKQNNKSGGNKKNNKSHQTTKAKPSSQ